MAEIPLSSERTQTTIEHHAGESWHSQVRSLMICIKNPQNLEENELCSSNKLILAGTGDQSGFTFHVQVERKNDSIGLFSFMVSIKYYPHIKIALPALA
jgi:hypothetical protein